MANKEALKKAMVKCASFQLLMEEQLFGNPAIADLPQVAAVETAMQELGSTISDLYEGAE